MQAWTFSLLSSFVTVSQVFFFYISYNTYMMLVGVLVRPSDHDPDFIAFQSQNKSCNEAVTKFEEAAKLRKAAIIRTAMGEEWRRVMTNVPFRSAFLHLCFVCLFSCCLLLFIKPVFMIIFFSPWGCFLILI